MTELTNERERAAFESEVRKVNDTAEIRERWPGGAYKHHGMEGRWQGWLMARRAAASSECASPPKTWQQRAQALGHDIDSKRFKDGGYEATFKGDEIADLRNEVTSLRAQIEAQGDAVRDGELLGFLESEVRRRGYLYLHNNMARYELVGLSIHNCSLRDALRSAMGNQTKGNENG